MRQLRDTGWMHNRLRMVVAMFLTKQLFIDWRWGERFFMQHLIDGDFAANNGGWQWSASTGTDAAPYFRVFNPVRQSQRFDPEGEFVRRWIPALRDLDNKRIHEPWRQPLLAPDYPAPVVSLGGVKENVTRAFRAAQEIYQAGGQ
jgi:deoxyribodipyrimidine photo-lyase